MYWCQKFRPRRLANRLVQQTTWITASSATKTMENSIDAATKQDVNEWAVYMKDSKLLAKLSKGHMIAAKAKYHKTNSNLNKKMLQLRSNYYQL